MDQKPWWMRFFWRYVDFETKREIIFQRERINSLERIIKLQRKSIDVLEITVKELLEKEIRRNERKYNEKNTLRDN